MSETISATKKQLPNPHWAQLPLFDRSKWKTVRFGDVVELISETSRDPASEGITRYIGLEHLEPGSLHIKTWGELAAGTTFTKRCREGQVLFGKRRAYQRKVAIAEFDALVSGDIYVFQAKADKLDPKLLPFLCMSERFFQFAVETSAGSLSPRTNWSHLAEFEFALPPLDQQRRIAELLWAVDEVEQSRTSLVDGIRASLSAYVTSALSNSAARQMKIRELGKVLTGSTPSTQNEAYYRPPEFMFVSPADIGTDRCVMQTEKAVSSEGLAVGRPIPKDTVMVVCIGSTIGKVAMSSARCITNQQINSIVCSEDFDPFVVYHVMLHHQGLFKQEAACTAVPLLNKSAFEQLIVRYPSAQTEAAFSRRIHDLEESVTLAEASILDTRALKNQLINTLA